MTGVILSENTDLYMYCMDKCMYVPVAGRYEGM